MDGAKGWALWIGEFLLVAWPWYLFTDHNHAWGWAMVGVIWDALVALVAGLFIYAHFRDVKGTACPAAGVRTYPPP